MKKFKQSRIISLSLPEIEKLQIFEENRDVRNTHVKNLCESIKETGIMTGSITLVNTNVFNEDPNDKKSYYYIVDGQHRRQAILSLAKEGLDISKFVRFEILPYTERGEILQYVSNINSLSKKFAAREYLELFKNDNENSFKVLELQDEFKNVSIDHILYSMYLDVPRNEIKKLYKSGNLPNETNPKVKMVLEIVSDLVKELNSKNRTKRGLDTFMIVLSKWILDNPGIKMTKGLKRKIVLGYIKASKSFSTLGDGASIRDIQVGFLNRILEN